MANKKNLLKGDERHKFTPEEHSKGGQASAEARRKKRDLRRALEALLEKNMTAKDGTQMTGIFEQALHGNVKAFETIRATVGQDPVQKVMVSEVDPAILAEVEKAVLDEDDE